MPDYPSAEQLLSNPLLSDVELPLRCRFYPLGFPLDLETNSPDVIRAAYEGWNLFTQEFDEAPVRLCLGVSESDTTLANPKSEVRARAHLMSIFADPENFMVCDFNARFAFGWVTSRVAADHPLLRYRFLTSTSHSLIEHAALAPIHGAVVARDGRGVMLCGASFAGKSTLAYACGRAGWTFVADDASFLVRNRSGRYAIGNPHAIRLREDARRLFPELEDRLAVVRPNGKIAIEVLTRELPISIASGCSIEHIVFLNRHESVKAHLRSYRPSDALEEFESHVKFGASEVQAGQKQCYRRLLEAGLWEMRYSDLDDAIARLEQMLHSGR